MYSCINFCSSLVNTKKIIAYNTYPSRIMSPKFKRPRFPNSQPCHVNKTMVQKQGCIVLYWSYRKGFQIYRTAITCIVRV